MSDKFISANLNITPMTQVKGIYYIGQYGTSGYASAARGFLYHYFSMGIPITWEPLYFDDSKLTDDDPYDVVLKSLIDAPIEACDVVILHSTPDIWPALINDRKNIIRNRPVIGICVWETNKIPITWVTAINNTVHEVWVPSNYNADALKNSGVTKIIRVVPYIFLDQKLPLKQDVSLKCVLDDMTNSNGKYTYYSIGEFNPRKGIDDLLQAFCEAFTNKDNVQLILKTHYKNYSDDNKKKCREFINEKIKPYSSPPRIICLFDNMTRSQILGLHSIGDCYVSLTKSEGFGLTIFDALKYNKSIIATGFGGHMDFLGNDYPGIVNYKIGPINEMSSFSHYYTSDQEWAFPDLEHAKQLMKRNYEVWQAESIK